MYGKLWCFTLVLAAMLAGCATVEKGKSLCIGKNADGTEQTVTAGQTFRIQLPSNPTTGYDWYISRLDQEYFQVIGTRYTPDTPQKTGSGGMKQWDIEALKSGTSAISFLYYRVWEGQEKAIEKYQVRLTIK